MNTSTRHWAKFVAALTIVGVVTIGLAAAADQAFGDNDPCTHQIVAGETLSTIAPNHGTTWRTLAAHNQIPNPDFIRAGDTINVCPNGTPNVSLSAPVLVPGHALEWAEAVTATRPEWATDRHVRFLVAVSGPESAWCTHIVNEGDRNEPHWGPSVGCIQVRTGLTDRILNSEPWRNRQWLEQSYLHQAEAGWIVLETQGRTAWGPARGGSQSKLQTDCQQTIRPGSCREYWAVADAALEYTQTT